jgi:glycosyltransferase involved in cell wall biosynthesis
MKPLSLLIGFCIFLYVNLIFAKVTFCKDLDLSVFKIQTVSEAVVQAREVKLNFEEIKQFYPLIDQTYSEVNKMVDLNSDQPLLSIVIPAYKEAKRLPFSLVKIQQFFNKYSIPLEINVIVEKSPDDTWEISSGVVEGDPRFHIIDNIVKQGKGYAVRSGMLRSTGKYVLFMDADLSTPLPEIFNFLMIFKDNPNYQVVIGDRKSNAVIEDQNRSLFRRALSYGFNQFVRHVSGSEIRDTQCGFKAFTSNATKQIFKLQSLNGFAFDVEILAIAQELKMEIEAVPVRWIDDERSTVNPIFDPIKMAIDLFKIRKIVRSNLAHQN